MISETTVSLPHNTPNFYLTSLFEQINNKFPGIYMVFNNKYNKSSTYFFLQLSDILLFEHLIFLNTVLLY